MYVPFPVLGINGTAISLYMSLLQHIIFGPFFQDRLEILLNTWIKLGIVPSPAEVSKEEGINFLWSKG